jgi:hypothetical protein
MIAQRIATSKGLRMITPASETRCGWGSCRYVSYIDGPADPDPHYSCELFDRRTDGRRLPECLQACDASLLQRMRGAALRTLECDAVAFAEVPFPPVRTYAPGNPEGLFRPSLRFLGRRMLCAVHGDVVAACLPDEAPVCPRCSP